MYVENLGELTADPRIDEWLVSQPVLVSYFSGARVPFILEGIEGQNAPESFENAIDAFLKLDLAARDEATPLVYQNYLDFVEAVDDEDVTVRIEHTDDVWQYVRPIDIHVLKGKDSEAYLVVQAECEWEIEHGLQLVFRGGSQLTRVSEQDGHLTD